MTTDQASMFPTSAAGRAAAAASRRSQARNLGRIEVFEDPADALAVWAELESLAPASVYQTRKWLLPWIETIGRATDITPMIVIAHAAQGGPAALFPFGVFQKGGVRLASFLGGRDSNSNLLLARPGFTFSQADVLSLLRAAALKARRRPDVFLLSNQPESWEAIANPLALLTHQRSPSECHSATLEPDGAAFIAKRLSSDARKKLRKKRMKLASWGPVAHVVAQTESDVREIIEVFFAQKLARFRQKNIASDFESPEACEFLLRACLRGLDAGAPAIELHALKAGERIVAVYAGSAHRGRFHAMVNSFDDDPAIGRTSPGDLLLMSMMEMMCNRGCLAFDLGIGEARYKSSWCDESAPLFETLHPVTLKGRAFALREAVRLRAKRYVKQNEWAWKAVSRLRARFG
jgi:CelD/BcsL family acetyltransferase involved in cellulose biosynthesis